MSVLSCNVNGCTNIMCSRFSYKLNKYICNSCYDRLLNTGILDRVGLDTFFSTEPPSEGLFDSSEYYEKIFPMMEY